MTEDLAARYGEAAKKLTKKLWGGFYEKILPPKELVAILSQSGFSWIGAASGEWFPDGAEGIRFFTRQWAGGDVPLIWMDRERYAVQPVGKDTLLVLGECRLRTSPESGLILAEMQRASFLYCIEGGALRLAHIHVSNPWQAMGAGEKFARLRGRINYEYFQQLVAEKKLIHLEGLTDRQREVLNLLAQGKSYVEVGEILAISPRTVRYHVDTLLIKYHAKNKAELLARLRT